jgi:hypothetical protein
MKEPLVELTRDTVETVHLESPDDIALADKMKTGRDQILTELHKVIVGQDDVVGQVLLTLFVGGNSLIVGVPGLAKTLLIHTLARVVDLKFSRIQFNARPDAVGHHRHRHHQRRSGHRSAADGICAEANLLQHPARG